MSFSLWRTDLLSALVVVAKSMRDWLSLPTSFSCIWYRQSRLIFIAPDAERMMSADVLRSWPRETELLCSPCKVAREETLLSIHCSPPSLVRRCLPLAGRILGVDALRLTAVLGRPGMRGGGL